MNKPSDARNTERASHLRWVAIADMKVSPKAQREFNPSQAAEYAADFKLEGLGYPVLSLRDGNYYILDGQHRIEALKLIGYGDQKVQCEVYEGLSEADEADLFLVRDRRRAVNAFDRFRIGVVAGREVETDINRIVMGSGLRIANDPDPKSIGAVAALQKIYRIGGPKLLARTIHLLRDGFPDDMLAFRREVVEGAGLLCSRYNGALDDQAFKVKLNSLKGGANDVIRKANRLKTTTSEPLSQCTAAAFVEVHNAGKGGRNLAPWWSK